MPKRRGLASQALMIVAASGVAQIGLASLYLLAARGSAPAEFGVVVAAAALGQSVSTFFDFGTTSLWVRELARGGMSTDTFSGRLRLKLLILVAASVIWALILLSFRVQFWWLAPASLFASVLSLNCQVPLRAAARAHLAAFAQIADRVSALSVFCLLWVAGTDLLNALAVGVVVGPLVGAATAALLTPRADRPSLNQGRTEFPWAGSWHYGLAGSAGGAQMLDLPLVSLFGGAASAGIYGAVSKWTQPMGLLATAFATASVPFIARSSSRREAIHHALRASWILVAACCIAGGVAIASPWIVRLLLGVDYSGASAVLTILAIGTIPAICNQPLASFLQTRHHDRYLAWVTVAGAAVQLCMIAALSATMGALGAAYAFLVLQVLNLILLACGLKLPEPHSPTIENQSMVSLDRAGTDRAIG